MNVLALQLKRIGDLVLTAPALRALKIGGANITLVVTEGAAGLLPALVGYAVDEALIYRAGGGNIPLWKRLASGGFDACVDFTGRDRSALMTLLSRARQRIIARSALHRGGWRRLAYNTRVDSSVLTRHTVDYYLEQAAAVHLPAPAAADPPATPLRLPADSITRADDVLRSAGLGDGAAFVVIHPGSARAEKYWVAERWAEVIRFLGSECGLRCVLTGGGGDVFEDEHLARIRAGLGSNSARCADLAGKGDLLTMTAVVARAALFVSVDSGPMHLAAAFQRPQIALFGPTNPFHWRPRHPHACVLQSGHGDRPVREFNPESSGGPMEGISTEAVIDCIKQLPP